MSLDRTEMPPIAATAARPIAPAAERRSGRRLDFGGPMRMRRAAEPEVFLLVCLCFLDMMTTLWWVVTGHATEANPFLQWTFHIHPIVFVLVKLLCTLPACYYALRLAQRYPVFTTWLMRSVLAVYLWVYVTNL